MRNRKIALLLALVPVSIAIAACSRSEPAPVVPTPAPPPILEPPPTEREAFAKAVDAYASSIALLARVPLSADYRGVRGALELLADAVELMPDLDKPAADQAAALMRNEWVAGWVALNPARPPSLAAKRSLQYAAGAFSLASSRRNEPSLQRAVADFERSIAALDEAAPLDPQHAALLTALEDARRVLEVIQRAAAPVARVP